MLKLVCLEVVIVAVSSRAMLQLVGKPPPIPDVIWAGIGLLAALTASAIALRELLVSTRRRRAMAKWSSRVPLERVGPYHGDALAVRHGRSARTVSLN